MYSQEIACVLALALVGSAAWAADEPDTTMTVCEVLRNARKLEGQLVRVRGVLQDAYPGASEPYFNELSGDGCTGLKTDRAVIRIDTPDVHFLKRPPPGYKYDAASAHRTERIIAEHIAKGRRLTGLSATVEGVFYSGGSRPDPSQRRRHRWYPGYIVIQAYLDVKPL
jgi:hypothetical protein